MHGFGSFEFSGTCFPVAGDLIETWKAHRESCHSVPLFVISQALLASDENVQNVDQTRNQASSRTHSKVQEAGIGCNLV